jgi:RluA family pseudouridine synthase
VEIIYLDESILIINKPAGLSVLPDGWEPDAPYVVKKLEEKFGKVFVVHRIDKFTSGVMVAARTAEAHRALNIQFEKHDIEKIYHAITVGVPYWDEKVTKFPLRTNVGHKHRTMVDNRNGLRSETRLKVIKRGKANVLLEAMPMTGRTHQIRVHAYALGFPLLGDVLYSAPETEIIDRPALHAYSLTFTHPETNERVTFTAPYPHDFKDALKIIRASE